MLLGHIVAQEGVKIDPKHVESISHLSLLRNKKEFQVFLGRINFLRRFIPNYAEIVKGITKMLKKENEVKWNLESQESFSRIKRAFAKAPMLVIPDYSIPFYIFPFSSPHTIAIVLLQNTNKGHEQLIAFFSQVLQEAELKFNILEKQNYALVKYLKAFRVYVLHSNIVAYVLTSNVKDILMQGDSYGKRGKWISKIQEYDMDIKSTKLIKGQGLAKLL